MSRQVYNEGRVTGFSAYEIFVRNVLAEDPNAIPPSEKEWLSSTIAMGTSMVVKVEADTTSGPHYRDIQFPSNTRLCAANTIIGNFFNGTAQFNGASVWASRISDFGPLISNTASSSPSGNVSTAGVVPTQSISAWPQAMQDSLIAYTKTIDGLVIQPGTWSATSPTPPSKKLEPNLTQYPRLRLFFADRVETSFLLLLTGFTMRGIIQGVTKLEEPTAPEDGDFLGPGAFPWASKVIFSVPNSAIEYIVKTKYTRTLSGVTKDQNATPIIDMELMDPATYYNTVSNVGRETLNITALQTTEKLGAAILTTWRRSATLPPALYGTRATGTGSNNVYPIDCIVPGTIKLYNGALTGTALTNARNLENNTPGNFAFIRRDTDYTLHILDKTASPSSRNTLPVAELSKSTITPAGGSTPAVLQGMKSGTESGRALSMEDSNGNLYAITGAIGNISTELTVNASSGYSGSFNFSTILRMLVENRSNVVSINFPYLTLTNGLRLYISNSQPPVAGVPLGSIGIGW